MTDWRTIPCSVCGKLPDEHTDEEIYVCDGTEIVREMRAEAAYEMERAR